jgi:hypothetical protein
MPHILRSARGDVVDVELVRIRAELAAADVNVAANNKFIESKPGEKVTPEVIINPNQKSSQTQNLAVTAGAETLPDEFDETEEK